MLRFYDEANHEHFAAIDPGILLKCDQEVYVSTLNGVCGAGNVPPVNYRGCFTLATSPESANHRHRTGLHLSNRIIIYYHGVGYLRFLLRYPCMASTLKGYSLTLNIKLSRLCSCCHLMLSAKSPAPLL